MGVIRCIFYVGLISVIAFLIWGYDDIRSLLADGNANVAWWFQHLFAITTPVVVSRTFSLIARSPRSPIKGGGEWLNLDRFADLSFTGRRSGFGLEKRREKACFIGGAFVFLVAPTLSYLLVSNGGTDVIEHSTWITMTCAVWFGLGTAVVVNSLMRFDPESKKHSYEP